ncbi:MAG TPA: binary toxin-like calcium binding domain-containing protein [Planctomycetota bacterium]|nr:binary toxin-like calcium binding domain-containing protein [Planctomycetota bacterium]
MPTLGALWQLVQDSTAPDGDADYLPDDVEILVGTNPGDRDTDHDGLPDNYEIFGSGYYDANDFVPDIDDDGFVAPVDADDDHDGRNDGEVMDTDKDGVANYLEYYGYTYDWMTGQFVLWDGDPDVEHWNTDPLQRSTDQDAFPDGMEVSEAIMDVSVQSPGDDPCVPAYPNIVIQLMTYAVTLNEEITYTDGGSLAKGTSWNRETVQTSSRSSEFNWEVGVQTKIGMSAAGPSGEVSTHYDFGGAYTNTQTTSTAVSTGGSVLDEQNWSRARSLNPTEAARIKLCLKVHNYGTASASNIIPTMTLRIGGINVATFEPGNAQINTLVPGGTYPPEPNVYWVVDSIDTGAGITPLTITMDELRALERGAPVSITVTQLLADVMLASDTQGWISAGDANEYLARCDAVSANIRVEVADGSFVHYLVYADDAPSAPRRTLGDALRCIGMDENGSLLYRDITGAPALTSLAGYRFVFDRETLLANGWDLSTQPITPPSEGFTVADTVLGPDTVLFVKSPREISDTGPTIYYANADAQTMEVTLCASDYQGIASVLFLDKDYDESNPGESPPLQMIEEIPDSGFYFLIVPDAGYVFDGTERVVVKNLIDQEAERSVDLVYYEQPPQPELPVFNSVRLDISSDPPTIYANVTSPNPIFPIKWVKAYHPVLDKGFVELGAPLNSYEDPDGWIADLPAGWGFTNLKLVAYTAPGCWSEITLTAENVTNQFVTSGTVTMYGEFDWTGADEWITSHLDFDTGAYYQSGWHGSAWMPSGTAYDISLFATQAGSNMWWIRFRQPHVLIDEQLYDFNQIDPAFIEAAFTTVVNDAGDYQYNDQDTIFVLRSDEGHLVKVKITKISNSDKGWPSEYHRRWMIVQYVVYEPNP